MPEVWGEGIEEGLVDTAAEGQIVLGQVVGDALGELEEVKHLVAGGHLM